MTGGTVGDGCVFCRAASGDDPLVVHRGDSAFVILNLFPYNSGHVMVVPRRHIASLGEATAEELGELITLVRDAERTVVELEADASAKLTTRERETLIRLLQKIYH